METHWETGRKVIVLENKVIISMIISKTYTEIESLGCLKGLFNIDKLYHTIKKNNNYLQKYGGGGLCTTISNIPYIRIKKKVKHVNYSNMTRHCRLSSH